MTLRSLLFAIATLAHQSVFAQPGDPSIDLFQLDEEHLYWQCAYPIQGAVDSVDLAVAEMLQSRHFISNVVRNDVGYNGDIKGYEINCKRYGRSYFNTPKVYCDGTWDGKFIVEVKDDFYRVTVYSLTYERTVPRSSNAREMEQKRGDYRSLVTNKQRTEIKRSERSNLLLMSLSLRDQFDLAESEKAQTPGSSRKNLSN
ncbi:MAG: hypothetical protein AB7K37_00165 [Cyclobacteriaceae bacterium]